MQITVKKMKLEMASFLVNLNFNISIVFVISMKVLMITTIMMVRSLY